MASSSSVPQVVSSPSAQFGVDELTIDGGAPSTQVAAADPQRRALTIVADNDNPGPIYIVPIAGVKRGGARILPGAGYTFDSATAAPVYVYAPAGESVVTVFSESGWSC